MQLTLDQQWLRRGGGFRSATKERVLRADYDDAPIITAITPFALLFSFSPDNDSGREDVLCSVVIIIVARNNSSRQSERTNGSS